MLARWRHCRFFSLAELNGVIRELIVDLNNQPMGHLGAARCSRRWRSASSEN
jgi:hypothetical protein